VAVRVAVAPTHIDGLFTVGVGKPFTVTDVLALAVQAVASVMVTEDVPVLETLIAAVVAAVLHR